MCLHTYITKLFTHRFLHTEDDAFPSSEIQQFQVQGWLVEALSLHEMDFDESQ